MEVTGSPSPMAEAKCAEDKNGVRRRVWESQDFTITKIVIEEGGDNQDGNEMTTPRFGAACSVQGEHIKWLMSLGCLNGTHATGIITPPFASNLPFY